MSHKKRIAIFISGRGSNMEAILRNVQSGCLSTCCEVSLVFSNNPSAEGLNIAAQHGVSTTCMPQSAGQKRAEYDAQIVSLLQPLQLDYIILAGYMRILSPVLINAFPEQIINIHPADTALHKGLHAYQWAFENGLQSTKITIHYVDSGVDTGRIIAQKEVDLKHCTTLEEVEKAGLAVEHAFYSQILAGLCKNGH